MSTPTPLTLDILSSPSRSYMLKAKRNFSNLVFSLFFAGSLFTGLEDRKFLKIAAFAGRFPTTKPKVGLKFRQDSGDTVLITVLRIWAFLPDPGFLP